MYYFTILSSITFSLIVLFGCNEGTKKATKRPPNLEARPGQQQEHPFLHKGRRLSSGYLENDYVVGPEDVLDIKVFGSEEFDRKVRVSNTGYITFPYIGTVKAEGLTLADLEFTLAGLLGGKYLKDPQISIFVEEFNSKKATVVGEVGKPQVLKLRRNSSTLFEVLGEAGGINEKAGKTVYVIRSSPAQAVAEASHSSGGPLQASLAGVSPHTYNPNPDDEKIMVEMQDMVMPINISELLEYRNPAANIEILPGDIITVPRGQFFFLMGEVANPGAHPLREGITALRALAMGGKLLPAHESSNIKLIRRESDGSTTFTTLNLKKISKGKEDDIEVLPGDVFIVGKSAAKTVALQTLELTKTAMNAFSTAFAWEAIRKD